MPRRLLLGQPVGVLPGQRPDEPRLAVVDVARGPDRQRHRQRSSGARGLRLPPRPRRPRRPSSVRQSRSVGRRGRRRRPAARRGGAAPQSASSTAHAALGSSASGSAPPPTRATVSSTSPPTSVGEPLRSGADGLDRLVEHAQHGDLVRVRAGSRRECERPLERGERQLVGAQRALERMPPQPLDELAPADDDTGLRSAEQLVAGERHEVGAGREALGAESARRRPSASAPEPRSSTSGSVVRARRPRRARRAAAAP